MKDKNLYKLRFPIGEFVTSRKITSGDIKKYIKIIEATPAKLRKAVEGLSKKQLDTPYRPGGWTVRQVIHHLPDSHLNSYVRFKLGLTEKNPIIRTYEEDRWAELQDSLKTPVEVSLLLLESLHKRWVILLKSMTSGDFKRTVKHPEWGQMRLDKLLAQYDWHCKHHVTHIINLKKRMNW